MITGAEASAVIVAAGKFTRMAGLNKQTALIDGIPVIVHTVRAFELARSISEIIVVARECDLEMIRGLCGEYSLSGVSAIIAGGETRQLSVKNGVQLAACEFTAVHDGARPMIRPEVIDTVVSAAAQYGGAAAAVRVKDTIKIADDSGFIAQTPPRGSLWQVQTPQVFSTAALSAAIIRAEAKGLDFTDDCQLMEMEGKPVYLCPGDYSNIKITTPEDLAVAESLWTGMNTT